MRIIAGEAKGRTLFAPPGDQTRPTSDKLRGSLFNILGARVIDAEVLDLFGGTGALALEALSRGAEFAVIADKAPAAVSVIRRNAENVLKDEFEKRVRILKTDYRTAIGEVRDRCFDLVFLDPPYKLLDSYRDAMERLEDAGVMAEDVLIVAERRSEAVISVPDTFEIYDTRNYRDTSVDFIRRRSEG